MGWAKYYEDNISICNDRWFMAAKETMPVVRKQIKAIAPKRNVAAQRVNKPKVQPVLVESPVKRDRNNRRGLELHFVEVQPMVSKKLQLNGWWWSKASGCWCNNYSMANRKYAETMVSNWNAALVVADAH